MTDPFSANSENTASRSWKAAVVAAVLLATALLLLVDTWRLGRPVELPNAAQKKLQCASYTPSHNGRMLEIAEKRALVASDLKLLASRFHCVRTYSVSEGLDDVPRIARDLGLKVMLGLWISMDAASNDREIARGIQLANWYPDVVTAIIVGNEVLLRRELTVAQLRTLIERVSAATMASVTYADVWEFWLRNADLSTATDFVTVHILPYWEDDPIDIDRALDHVQSIYSKVQSAFPESEVLIGETGWPSAGRPRLNAVPSVINEARFIREFVAYAETKQIPYNLIEAFDQPWKRNQEGTVGGYWGLFDAEGKKKFAFTGPVIADGNWRLDALTALLGAVLFGAIGGLLRPRPSVRAIALMAIAGHSAGTAMAKQWLYLSTSNRTVLEWIATSSWSVTGWCAVITAAIAFARWIDGAQISQPLGISTILRSLGHGAEKKPDRIARWLGLTRLLVLFGTAYACLGLAYDGRGRDFPLSLMALPAGAFILLEVIASPKPAAAIDREELLLAFAIAACCVFVAFRETHLNTRSVAWCGLCVVFAAAVGVGHWRALHANHRAEQHPSPA